MSSRLIMSLLGFAMSANLAAQTCNDNMPASTPNDRFTINADGTVTDIRTGLIWKRCLEGQSGTDCSGTASLFTWQEALQHAAAQTGWRLPNIKELTSIVELKCYNPAINLSVFPKDPGSYVWSGSPNASSSYGAWYVSFGNGNDHGYSRNGYQHVRLVRGGQ